MSLDLPTGGLGAPPRANGELVFDAPWQSRVFGVAAALEEADHIVWSDFQAALIRRVREADGAGLDTGEPDGYWRCWLDALAALTGDKELVDGDSWSTRCVELAARPAGHDH